MNPTYRDDGYNYRYSDDMRVDDRHNMYRVAPRHRDPMPWDRAGYFWGDHPHYYGYRIHSLPPHWRRIRHWGIDYYYYNGIYYRPYGGPMSFAVLLLAHRWRLPSTGRCSMPFVSRTTATPIAPTRAPLTTTTSLPGKT